MVSNRRARSWENIKIGEDSYMISVSRNDDDTIEVFLTNLIELWTEVLPRESILLKFRKLNALLNVDVLDYNEIVVKLVNNISEHVIEASVDEIKLRTKIEGGFVKFNMNFTKASAQQFYEVVTKPLCTSSSVLLKQRETLISLIKRKDEEIAEYKAEGAELIRKNIETKTFNEDQFKADFGRPEALGCTGMFQTAISFYNTLKSDRSPERIENDSSSGRARGDGKLEETEKLGTPSVKKEAKDDSPSAKSGKKTPQKKPSTRVVYEPPKRRKKNLNNFL